MKSRLTVLLAIAMTFLLTGCAGLLGPREVELPLYKLQEAMDRKFPFNHRYLEIFDMPAPISCRPKSRQNRTVSW